MTKAEVPTDATGLDQDFPISFSTPCVFPFEHDGVIYNNCINLLEENPDNFWCNTRWDGTGWGYCDPSTCGGSNFLMKHK